MPTGIYKRTKKHCAALSKNAQLVPRGPRHYLCTKNPTYRTIHNWMENNFGKPNKCEECGLSKKPKLKINGRPFKDKRNYFQWANINKKGIYLRNRKDWKMLCTRCHAKKDRVRFPKHFLFA